MHPAGPTLITLTTDFGAEGPFVAAMKGVMLSINPKVNIVDVTHHIGAHNIREGAFLLRSVEPYFPRNCVHVVVVDPGVGSERRPLLVVTERSMFVGPDNGVLSPTFDAQGCQVYHMTAGKFFLTPISSTFHGRDVFAPAAAWLSTGVKPAVFGALVNDPLRLDLPAAQQDSGGGVRGEVMYVDRFGNLITNISAVSLQQAGVDAPVIHLGGRDVHGLCASYSECAPGNLGALHNSWGMIEVFTPQQSAAAMLDVGPGEPVRVEAAQA